MGKDELDRILENHGCPHEDCVAQAKSAILAWCREQLPEKLNPPKSDDDRDFLEGYFSGFNNAIKEMKRRFE